MSQSYLPLKVLDAQGMATEAMEFRGPIFQENHTYT